MKNIISFDLNEIDRNSLLSLVDYYDVLENKKELERTLSEFIVFEDKEEETISELILFGGKEGKTVFEETETPNKSKDPKTLTDLCNYLVRKDYYPDLFSKFNRLFNLSIDRLVDYIFSDIDLNIGIDMNRETTLENVSLLRDLILGMYVKKFPNPKFVEDFIREIDTLLKAFDL